MGMYYIMEDQQLFCRGCLLTKMGKDIFYVEAKMISNLHVPIEIAEKSGGLLIHGASIVQDVERWAID